MVSKITTTQWLPMSARDHLIRHGAADAAASDAKSATDTANSKASAKTNHVHNTNSVVGAAQAELFQRAREAEAVFRTSRMPDHLSYKTQQAMQTYADTKAHVEGELQELEELRSMVGVEVYV